MGKLKSSKKNKNKVVICSCPDPHTATNMVMKNISVDINIQPVVYWLNSFQTVFTEWSCEGGPEADTEHHKPYIIFNCHGHDDLLDILDFVSDVRGAVVEIERFSNTFDVFPRIRYTLRMENTEVLERFTARLMVYSLVPPE